eukprot:8419718-Pyramimonas_sp.AAC.1
MSLHDATIAANNYLCHRVLSNCPSKQTVDIPCLMLVVSSATALVAWMFVKMFKMFVKISTFRVRVYRQRQLEQHMVQWMLCKHDA